MKLTEQELSEQCVVAVPPSPTIQRNQERVGGLELAQAILAARIFHEGVAKRGTQLIEHRSAPQESLRVVRKQAQRLPVKVVGHKTIVTGNGRNVAAAGSSDHRREVEAGRPAFSPRRCSGGLLACRSDVCLREDLLGRLDVQGQVAGTELPRISTSS